MILTKENIDKISIDQLIDEKIRNNKFDEFLLVVPTNRKLRQQKKEIISLSPEGIATSLNIETLSTLFLKILKQIKNVHELSDEAAMIFIEQSISELELKYFNNYKGNIPHGTLERIKNVISKYKEEGITHDLLREEAVNLKRSEKLKAIDIANIYERYLKLCMSLNVFELGDVYRELSDLDFALFEEAFSELFKKVKLIVLQGFDKFTHLEIQIINKLASIKGIKLFLVFDYSLYNHMIFSHLDETYSRFQKHGFIKVKEKEVVDPDAFTEIVKKELFLNKKRERINRFKNSIVRIDAANREDEIELIGKEIKRLLIEESISPSDISVTFNLINNYSHIIRDKFSALGIPFNLTDRLRLDSSLAVTALISFLEILNSDFYYKNILRAFGNSLLNIKGIEINSLLYSATSLKIVAGKKNWVHGILRGIALEEKNVGLSKNSNALNNFKKAQKSIDIISDYLTEFEKPMLPLRFYELLKQMIHKLKLSENILKSNISNKEKEIKALTTLLEATEETFGLIQKESDTKYTLNFYMEKLYTLISSTRFNVKELSNYGVLVTNINELRGLKFKYSFIGGLIDGDFPTKYRPEIFFSGKYGKKDLQHLREERFHFYQSLASWNKGLYLSLPTGDGEKRVAESTFIKDFENLFEVIKKNKKDYEAIIYSEDEAQKKIPLDFIEGISSEEKESLSDAIEREKKRILSPYSQSFYSGFVLDEEENLFESIGKNEQPYSISQLETYGSCPFKYFLERVLRIETNEEPDEEVESVVIGSLLHTILYEFYTEIKKRNIKIKNCSDSVFSIAETILFDIAEKYVNEQFEYSPISFFEKEKLIGIEGERSQSVLFRFLDAERRDSEDRIPEYFETNFGVEDVEQDKELSASAPLMVDDIKLRGKIDRIDINKNNKEFEVIDYKSGSKTVTAKEIEEGRSLQLPIYIWAAKELLLQNKEEEYIPAAMTIYSLKYSKDKFGKHPVKFGRKKVSEELINEYVNIALNHVKESVNKIRKGEFPVTRYSEGQNSACRFCSYKMICRIDTIKIN